MSSLCLIREAQHTNKMVAFLVKGKYPTRKLIPFAKLNYSDDIVCFDGADTSEDPKIYYVHAFASAGWEDRGYTDNFSGWLKMARLESARYKAERAEDDE